jgi:predicted metal-dependent peptidase
MDVEAAETLAKARFEITKKTAEPYLSAIIYSLIPVEEKGFGTIGVTEHGVLIYDPEQVKKWKGPMLNFGLMHECHHVWRKHPTRKGNRDHKVFNIAADCTINGMLMQTGI